MMARFEEREEVAQQAQEAGFELTEELMRWSGIAIMKKAYHLLREREYPSKLLQLPAKVGPEEGPNTPCGGDGRGQSGLYHESEFYRKCALILCR